MYERMPACIAYVPASPTENSVKVKERGAEVGSTMVHLQASGAPQGLLKYDSCSHLDPFTHIQCCPCRFKFVLVEK